MTTRLHYLVAHRRRQIGMGKPARNAPDPRDQELRDRGWELAARLRMRRRAMDKERARDETERELRARDNWVLRAFEAAQREKQDRLPAFLRRQAG